MEARKSVIRGNFHSKHNCSTYISKLNVLENMKWDNDLRLRI
jgi:hypothetical protein